MASITGTSPPLAADPTLQPSTDPGKENASTITFRPASTAQPHHRAPSRTPRDLRASAPSMRTARAPYLRLVRQEQHLLDRIDNEIQLRPTKDNGPAGRSEKIGGASSADRRARGPWIRMIVASRLG
jgi:hypothetical protein